jgi:hypothetical protein
MRALVGLEAIFIGSHEEIEAFRILLSKTFQPQYKPGGSF